MNNRISLHIPPADLQAARQHIEQAVTLLKPHIEVLTPDEVQALFKVSDKGSGFLEKSVGYSHTNPAVWNSLARHSISCRRQYSLEGA